MSLHIQQPPPQVIQPGRRIDPPYELPARPQTVGPAGWSRRFLIGGLAASIVSIFVANILFALAWFFWLRDCRRRRRFELRVPTFGWFFLAYAIGVTISIILSPDPLESAINLKKLLQFCTVFLFATLLDRGSIRTALAWVFPLMAASSLYAVLQYFWLLEITPVNRVRGFMSHWMTFSGQIMLGITALAALAVFDLLRRPQWRSKLRVAALVGCFLLLCGALLLTQTRNAWLGAAVALMLLTLLYGFESPGRVGKRLRERSAWLARFYGLRWSTAAALVLVAVFLLLPVQYKQRFWAAFDPQDYTTSIRLELLRTGKEMILDHPWKGLGPRLVPRRHGEYSIPGEFPPEIYQHLHNNFVQVAAESGLPTFVLWMSIWAALAVDLIRRARRARSDRFLLALTIGALAAMCAFLVGGLFEYNFGDSEVLILLLFLIAAPYAAHQPAAGFDPPLRPQQRLPRRQEDEREAVLLEA